MAYSTVSKIPDKLEKDYIPKMCSLEEENLNPKKFNRISWRNGIPNSFQKVPRYADKEDIKEIENFFNKKFNYQPPECGWCLPDVDKMFVSERWELEDMMNMKEELNSVKNKLNNFDLDKWHKHTRAMNKAANVMKAVRYEVNGEFVTQAWCKFYEICSSYKLICSFAQHENTLNTFHICEAPGAFITSLNHYIQLNHPKMKWKWLATTLNPYYEGNPLPNMVNDDRFILHTLDRWKFGVDYTGNLMDRSNLRSLVLECRNVGPMLLITADGSIDCQDDPGEQESIVYQLLFCEVVAALHILSTGGNFLVKMFTMYEPETICLMYLLACCFESINVFKPATSKEGNSENYVVCLNYVGVDERKPWLRKLLTKYSSDVPAEMMFSLNDIPEDFIKQHKECAEKFKNYQIEVIERNIFLFQLDNNTGSLRNMRRLSFLVKDEYLSRYNLQPISEELQIVGEYILRTTETPNVDLKESFGSFNDRVEKQKARGLEKLKMLMEDLKRSQIQWTYDEDIKWLECENYTNEFKIVFGKPVTSVRCSKFCLGKMLTLRNVIADVAKEIRFMNPEPEPEPSDSEGKLYTQELSSEIKKIIDRCNPSLLKKLYVLNYKEKLWVSLEGGKNEAFERSAFFDIMDLIDSMWRDDSFVLQGYPMLTQFTVGVVYMIGHLFEKVGFVRPVGQDFAVIFQHYRCWNVKMKNFLDELDCEVEQLDRDKSVLAVIPLTQILFGHDEFYKSVNAVNSLCVQEQNRVRIAQMMREVKQ